MDELVLEGASKGFHVAFGKLHAFGSSPQASSGWEVANYHWPALNCSATLIHKSMRLGYS